MILKNEEKTSFPGCPTQASCQSRFLAAKKLKKIKCKGSKEEKGKHDTTYSPYTYLSTNK
jgi:hypothetical protein